MPEFNGPHKDEVESFFTEEASRQRVAEEVETVANRMTVFLSQRGVPLDEPPVPEGITGLRASAIREFSVIVRRDDMAAVASQIVSFKSSDDAADTAKAQDLKKRLQARLIAKEYDQNWLDAVHHELPGEPLDSVQDTDLIAEAINKRADQMAMMESASDMIREKFLSAMGCSSRELSGKERIALMRLIGEYGDRQWTPEIKRRTAWSEEARVLLLEMGIELTPRWQRLIEIDDMPDES